MAKTTKSKRQVATITIKANDGIKWCSGPKEVQKGSRNSWFVQNLKDSFLKKFFKANGINPAEVCSMYLYKKEWSIQEGWGSSFKKLHSFWGVVTFEEEEVI